MFPPVLHLFASKLTLKPQGKDKALPYAMFLCGPNGQTIQAIKSTMLAT